MQLPSWHSLLPLGFGRTKPAALAPPASSSLGLLPEAFIFSEEVQTKRGCSNSNIYRLAEVEPNETKDVCI